MSAAIDTSTLVHQLLGCGSGLSESEKWVVRWQFGLLGGFQAALARAIAAADDTNLAALRLGFPMQVDGYRAWRSGDLARRLREAGLDI